MRGSRRARPIRGCRRRQATGSGRCVGGSGSAMRGADRRFSALLLTLGAGFALPLAAQNAEPPRAPRILDTPVPRAPAPASTVEPADLRVSLPAVGVGRRPPNAARLAPLPEERD